MGRVPVQVTVDYGNDDTVVVDVAAAEGQIVSVFWGDPQVMGLERNIESSPAWMSSSRRGPGVCWVDSNGVLHCPHPT